MMSVFTKLNGFREDSEAGFTLMEIIVVITIMGILAAIGIPIFMSQRANAVDDALVADLKIITDTANSVRAHNPNDGYIVYRNGYICTSATAYSTSCPPSSPKPVTTSGGTFGISGGGGSSGSRGEYYASAYHPNANKYNSYANRLYYDSLTKRFRQVGT